MENRRTFAARTGLALASGLVNLPSWASRPETAPDKIPSRRDILAIMHKVNDWQISHPKMPADNRTWERGTWYTGVTGAWKETRDRKFLNQAMAWGRQHKWQVGTEPGGANKLFCVETWVELYFESKDRAMIEPAIKWLDTPAPNTPAGAKRWYLEAWGLDHIYVDSLYGAPALAMLAKATGDKKYLAILEGHFDDVTAELFDQESGLYYRDARFKGKKTANGRKILWSRGNGWAFGAITRILEYLPKDYARRVDFVKIFERMASELVKRQGADGLWRPNLDDPKEVPIPETSGSGFFCFGLAWGVREGLLDRSKYLPAVTRAWAGLCRSVTPDGAIQWGQQVDFQPNAIKQDSTHEYVTGAFLLAGSQMYALSAKQ